tara:strand:+ start:1856 stop:2866 length:1011 start_codon:yes stop_codon:yes gene_type:complete
MNPLSKDTELSRYENHSVIVSGIANFHKRVMNSEVDGKDVYVVFTAFYVSANKRGMFTSWFRDILSRQGNFILALNSYEEELNVRNRFGKEILEKGIILLHVGEFVFHYLLNGQPFYIKDVKKEYGSILNSKKVGYKKRGLGDLVTDKILITSTPKRETGDIPCLFKNEKLLSYSELNDLLNKCNMGMMLSKREGQPRAMIEYFLCGLPMVSLEADGGRMSYLNKGNSIIIKDGDGVKSNIKRAVDFLNENIGDYDAVSIRKNFISNMRFALDMILKNASLILNSTYGYNITHEDLINSIDSSTFETAPELRDTSPQPLNFEAAYTYIDNLPDKTH